MNSKALYLHGGRKFKAIMQTEVVEKPVGILHDEVCSADNYAHWLLDWLPRIELMRQSGVDVTQSVYVVPQRALPNDDD